MRMWEFHCMACGCIWYMDLVNEDTPKTNFCPGCGRPVGEWLNKEEKELPA